MAWGGLPPLPHLQQQGTHSLGMALISSGAIWNVWDSRENCCQIKDVPHHRKSCQVHVFSLWLFPVTAVFLIHFFEKSVCSRGKLHSKKKFKKGDCVRTFMPPENLSPCFQIYF